jgi:hypothetical protein
MKRYKMDKWGQLPFLSEPVKEDGPWTVRSISEPKPPSLLHSSRQGA